ncbi:MAG: heavy metal-binding domain-containing protein, partial [Planctomycetes bacterium]|nr:heavy metal-binding domain-containing protein [Planctomycetota bacterium]
MAKDPNEQPPQGNGEGAAGPGLSPAKRKQLQRCFEHANLQTSQENYDYATELFTQCVAGDPANFIYLQAFLTNLKKKYNNNKKGSNLAFIQGRGARGAAKKAASQKDWPGVIKAGLEALKLNPWDVATLKPMADAAGNIGARDCKLAYLKIAQEANAIGADDVVGIKTHIHDMGGGLIEFMAIGTAVKRAPGIRTHSDA